MPFSPVPPLLQTSADTHWQAYLKALKDKEPPGGAWAEEVRWVFAMSDFVARTVTVRPALLTELVESGDLERPCGDDDYGIRARGAVADAESEDELVLRLRRLRQREMVRIAWRDLTGRADLEGTVTELSAFCEAVLQETLSVLHRWQCRKYGEPRDRGGAPQSLVVVAMGKLGARELNFSSDIDLVFAFPENGETTGGRRTLTNQEFFIRLGQRLIRVLETATAEGFVFRVDMRLRPFGGSGPLAVSFGAMEDYYQTHGRDWERYAWLKARPVAGDPAAGARLMRLLGPFVYRRYLDYGAYQALRDMKARVDQEVARRGLEHNVKLGRGGIREVEFIAQAFQLIRGGREPALRETRLRVVLDRLAAGGQLPAEVVAGLKKAYVFLRNTEHRLQEADDRQTQTLPGDEAGRQRLAAAMGFGEWPGFEAELAGHREYVATHFAQVFAAPEEEEGEARASPLQAVWSASLDEAERRALLAQAGFPEPEPVLALLDRLHDSYPVRTMSHHGRERLDRLVPLLLEAVGRDPDPPTTLERLLGLVERVARRSVYLSLLAEHPVALEQLVKLCAASPWISAHLTRFPILLDELLDPRTLYDPPDRAGLVRELEVLLDNVEAGDTEQEMDTLRLYAQTNTLRVAAADIVGVLPLMKVSDHLSDLAEVILEGCLRLAWRDVAGRYGTPAYTADGERHQAGFLIVAYGKLGGLELGYGSDLDVVFLHGSRGADQHTEGGKETDNDTFFARLGKRLTHLITTPTAAGTVYEMDYRLRPSGASGLLVSAMDAFEDYQERRAWTWEHQALVRARPVVGEEALKARFEAIRQAVLCRPRDGAALREEVRQMRERMRRELSKGDDSRFDLKQDRGGIADIEFMVQYGVLLWAFEHPAVARYTDNIRILEAFSRAGLMAAGDADLLADAYRAYRGRGHRCALQQVPAVVGGGELRDYREGVGAIWDKLMEA